ncbi:cytochrome P450 [Crossiella sp. NPDC003009]
MNVDPLPRLPLGPPNTMGPPVEFPRLRRECPVVRVAMPPVEAWFVTRYQDVRTVLADPRLVRPTIQDVVLDDAEAPAGPHLVTMMELDGPRHLALSRCVREAFGIRAVRRLLPRIRAVADELLDQVEAAGQPGDLVTGYAEPFPLRLVCELVGIPYADRDYFLPLADSALGAVVTLEDGRSSTPALLDYMGDLVDRKRREPADDVLSEMVRHWAAGLLDREQVLAFGLSMLVAGYRTTTMYLANSIVVLLTHDQYRALNADRGLLPGAVEELLRFIPVMNGVVVLKAVEDLELAGCPIRSGETVLPVIASANLDESVFPDPDRFDPRRNPNPHLGLGRGAHSCAGGHLARAELQIALEALLDRFPRLRLAVPETDLNWEEESPARSPLILPVHW